MTIIFFLVFLNTIALLYFLHSLPLSAYLKLNAGLEILNQKILSWPDLYWIIGSYLAAYFLYFISPVFLNSGQRMSFQPDSFALDPIGLDLRAFLYFGKAFFLSGGEYPPANLYPPLFTLLIAPFSLLDPVSLYRVFVPVLFVSYVLITLVIPIFFVKSQQGITLLVLFFLSGLFSHGFYFELERGQTNVIAFLFVMLAIYLFYHKTRFRWLAYVLFSLSLQIKIFPAIFIFMLVENWSDWKTNIKRFAGIGLFNLALFFVLGLRPLLTVVSNLKEASLHYVWIRNHSIMSFAMLLQKGYFQETLNEFNLSAVNLWAMEHAIKIGYFLTFLAFLCFGLVIFHAIRSNSKGFNSNLFVVSTLVLLLVPAVSHDYTLSLLSGAVGVALAMNQGMAVLPSLRLLRTFLVILITFSYSTALYSFEYKPLFWQDNFFALMILLFCFTIMSFLPRMPAASFQEDHNQILKSQ